MNGYLEPQPVPHLEAGVSALHCATDCLHPALDRQRSLSILLLHNSVVVVCHVTIVAIGHGLFYALQVVQLFETMQTRLLRQNYLKQLNYTEINISPIKDAERHRWTKINKKNKKNSKQYDSKEVLQKHVRNFLQLENIRKGWAI